MFTLAVTGKTGKKNIPVYTYPYNYTKDIKHHREYSESDNYIATIKEPDISDVIILDIKSKDNRYMSKIFVIHNGKSTIVRDIKLRKNISTIDIDIRKTNKNKYHIYNNKKDDIKHYFIYVKNSTIIDGANDKWNLVEHIETKSEIEVKFLVAATYRIDVFSTEDGLNMTEINSNTLSISKSILERKNRRYIEWE